MRGGAHAAELYEQCVQVYITDITLTPEGRMGEEVPISVHSWVNLYHTQTYGPRVFFAVSRCHQQPCLPLPFYSPCIRPP